jgi:hypothetical protein
MYALLPVVPLSLFICQLNRSIELGAWRRTSIHFRFGRSDVGQNICRFVGAVLWDCLHDCMAKK